MFRIVIMLIIVVTDLYVSESKNVSSAVFFGVVCPCNYVLRTACLNAFHIKELRNIIFIILLYFLTYIIITCLSCYSFVRTVLMYKFFHPSLHGSSHLVDRSKVLLEFCLC